MPLVSPMPPSSSPMGIEQIRKRPLTDDIPQSNPSPKKPKSTSSQHIAPNFPPSFYDGLSEVPLTLDSLKELDRRNKVRAHKTKLTVSAASVAKSLLRYSRRGGADPRHLRGFPGPKRSSAIMDRTPSSSSSRNRVTQSTRATSVSARSGRSSACDKGFQQHLIDHKIYPEGYEAGDGLPSFEPTDLDDIQEALHADRASLSPSQFTQEAFQDFKSKNKRVVFESDVMSTVIPVICGDSKIHSQQNVLFTELEPITSTDAVKPKPDLFDGAFLVDIDEDIRNDPAFRSKIIPTKHRSVPVASNFFMEVKGPDGNASVAQRQACYDGAYGARAMHALQNYGKTESEYDENASTFSSTYHDGQLKLYVHHVTAPTTSSPAPEYHMSQAGAYALSHSRQSFIEGATAFRNARDLAKRYRGDLIRAANAKVRDKASKAQEGNGQYDNDVGWRDANDALQENINATADNSSEDCQEEHELPQNLHTDDDSQNHSQASTALGNEDPSLSFVTSVTSSVSSETPIRSKRTRQLSSPSNSWRSRSSKSRTRSHINQLATEESARVSAQHSEPSGSEERL